MSCMGVIEPQCTAYISPTKVNDMKVYWVPQKQLQKGGGTSSL